MAEDVQDVPVSCRACGTYSFWREWESAWAFPGEPDRCPYCGTSEEPTDSWPLDLVPNPGKDR